MKSFYYNALNSRGEECQGNVEASDEAKAIQKLRLQWMYPTRVSENPDGAQEAVARTRPVFNRATSPATALILALTLLMAFAFIIFCVLERADEKKPVRRHQPEGQTLIIDGKAYTVIILPQEVNHESH